MSVLREQLGKLHKLENKGLEDKGSVKACAAPLRDRLARAYKQDSLGIIKGTRLSWA